MPPTPSKGTEYVVLASDDGTDWQVLDRISASSEAAAKVEVLRVHRPQGGWVVAVPARSWKPEDKRPKLTFI